MTGYDPAEGTVLLVAACHQCGTVFMSDPSYVPSLRLEDGHQVVFCRPCVVVANQYRAAHDLPLHPIHPGAYP